MAFAFVIAPCWLCGRVFTMNPVRVPSFKDRDGVKQPVCQDCIAGVNILRAAKGLDAFVIPADAYEACDESELG